MEQVAENRKNLNCLIYFRNCGKMGFKSDDKNMILNAVKKTNHAFSMSHLDQHNNYKKLRSS